MTRYERFVNNKEELVELIQSSDEFFTEISGWWCSKRCPYRIDGKCIHEECQDDTDYKDVVRCWLDSED